MKEKFTIDDRIKAIMEARGILAGKYTICHFVFPSEAEMIRFHYQLMNEGVAYLLFEHYANICRVAALPEQAERILAVGREFTQEYAVRR